MFLAKRGGRRVANIASSPHKHWRFRIARKSQSPLLFCPHRSGSCADFRTFLDHDLDSTHFPQCLHISRPPCVAPASFLQYWAGVDL